MVASPLTDRKVIRCPVCLAQQTVMPGTLPQSRLTCVACRRKFERQEALPLKESSPVPVAAPAAGVEASRPARWAGSIAAMAGGLALTLWIGKDKDGPDFLLFYLIVWAVTFFGSIFAKILSWGPHAGVVAFVVFEGLGVARIITGVQQGMHKFGVLLMMMLIGGLFYVAKMGAESASGGGCPVGGCSSGCSGGGF